MKYQRFEELPAWQVAVDLAVQTYALTAKGGFEGYSGLRGQLERAALSVSNNIAEGFERGTREELISFLYIARGSAGEVRSMLCVLDRLPYFGARADDVSLLKAFAENVSRQLGAWIEALKNVDGRGPRYKNQQTRQRTQAVERRDAFLDELRRIQRESRTPNPGGELDPPS